ncbi:hypothetical protein Aduo_001514 [Ancylostoma duodenale]
MSSRADGISSEMTLNQRLTTLFARSHEYTRLPEEQVIRVPRNCRGRLSLLGEEYWSSVGYDGRLRITKDRYGEGVHYEVFGHAFLRNDGRVCAWFAGRDRDAIELCEGFRVLSRNRNNPNEEMPFEWVLAGYARPRETIGFHHHRIAKYDWSRDELSTPDQFIRKIWVLRRKPEVSAVLHPRARLD